MPDDILTQNVIDSLLAQAMGEGNEQGATQERFRSIRPYDFRHPSKLSKEQVRALQLIFESFARLATASLSTLLRAQAHMALVSIQQAVFDEYLHGLPASSVLHLATAPPLPGSFVFEYDLATAFLMIERLLGGQGKIIQQGREATDLEAALLQTIGTVFMTAFSEAWAHIVPIEATLMRLEYSPRFLQIASDTEPVVLLLFDLRVLDRQTTVSLCLPYTVIEGVAADLNLQTVFTVAQKAANNTGQAMEAPLRLQTVSVPVVTILGSTTLTLGDVVSLQVGDVIRLDGSMTDPLIVTVTGKPTFYARAGTRRKHIAVQILDVFHDEDDYEQ
jgi:flagellar motor switch protein FliM